jgi:hypothetical protein
MIGQLAGSLAKEMAGTVRVYRIWVEVVENTVFGNFASGCPKHVIADGLFG